MTSVRPLVLCGVVLAGFALAPLLAADAGGAARPGSPRGAAGARGVLPDPALLDGSAHAPEKRSAIGMIGDFELPGDEQARTDKVGGASQPPGPNGNEAAGEGTGGAPGRPGGQGKPEANQAGGAGGKEEEKPAAGAGDQAQGIQVAELKGEAAAPAPDGKGPSRPTAMAIGDQAMRIPQQPRSPAVVGTQQVANVNTQDYEKGTGTGGKGPVNKGGPNRTEKGRVIPSGL
ncbi:MAG: hypothetical protein FJ397_06525 [Verrucomicrobia bacterium]|nr:hypothetical protein [Verrucomicrobiota bacterium]